MFNLVYYLPVVSVAKEIDSVISYVNVSEFRFGATKYIEILLYAGSKRKTQLYRVKKHEIKGDDCIPLIRIKSIEFRDVEPRGVEKYNSVSLHVPTKKTTHR